MKKKVIIRGLIGFPLGVFIGYTITILISLGIGTGDYEAAVPTLIGEFGSEVMAVVLQYILSGVLGAACAAGSVVWEIDRWSILKQSAIHFLILSFSMLPIAYYTHWMEHSFTGIVSYFGFFIGMYIIIWITQYIFWKYRIKKINEKVKSAD